MKRDKKLLFEILKYVEETSPGLLGILSRPDIPGYTNEQVSYHVVLCQEAGYVHFAEGTRAMTSLTWAGHEALEVYRCNPCA